jgi:hypothetical protein
MERDTGNLRQTRRFRQLGSELSDRPAHHLFIPNRETCGFPAGFKAFALESLPSLMRVV